VRSVTGRACIVGRGNETGKLVDALVEACPEIGKRIEFARAKAVTWATQRKARGLMLNVHNFVDWLGSGEPDPAATRKPWEPPPAAPPKKPTPETIAEAEAAYEAATRERGTSTVSAVVAAVTGRKSA
jgi:ADP-ribose pyrophosphatase YjhB (NUDIX family)